jgi:hypothetical protein
MVSDSYKSKVQSHNSHIDIKKENPHTDLKEAKYYKEILDKWEADNAL